MFSLQNMTLKSVNIWAVLKCWRRVFSFDLRVYIWNVVVLPRRHGLTVDHCQHSNYVIFANRGVNCL